MKLRVIFYALCTLPLLCGWKNPYKPDSFATHRCNSCFNTNITSFFDGSLLRLCSQHQSVAKEVEEEFDEALNEAYALLNTANSFEEEKRQLEENLAMCDDGGWFSSNKRQRYFLERIKEVEQSHKSARKNFFNANARYEGLKSKIKRMKANPPGSADPSREWFTGLPYFDL